jgi:hypothetical protein
MIATWHYSPRCMHSTKYEVQFRQVKTGESGEYENKMGT